MTIDDMISALEDARDELGGDAEVRIAWQQHYPLRGTVTQVHVPDSPDAGDLYGDGEYAAGQEKDGLFCWIATEPPDAPENPYGPEWAWE